MVWASKLEEIDTGSLSSDMRGNRLGYSEGYCSSYVTTLTYNNEGAVACLPHHTPPSSVPAPHNADLLSILLFPHLLSLSASLHILSILQQINSHLITSSFSIHHLNRWAYIYTLPWSVNRQPNTAQSTELHKQQDPGSDRK
jgi:hypothetical protein